MKSIIAILIPICFTIGCGAGGTSGSDPILANSISTGESAFCAIDLGGQAWCRGNNLWGDAGSGSSETRLYAFEKVTGLSATRDVSASKYYGCGLKQDGTAWCWGRSDEATLGTWYPDGPEMCEMPDDYDPDPCSRTPVQVPGIAGASKLSAGGTALGGHACVILSDGSMKCWGENYYGQLGYGYSDDGGVEAVDVSVLSGVETIAAGGDFTCAVKNDQTLWCWGTNQQYELGMDADHGSEVPVPVAGFTDASMVAAGETHACAIRTDKTVWCWGGNLSGQVGNGTTSLRELPAQVPGLSGAIAISVSDRHSCAALEDGSAWCWGNNNMGELGDGTTDDSSDPVQVQQLTGAVQVSCGGQYTCARTTDNAVWCWGNKHVFSDSGADFYQFEPARM